MTMATRVLDSPPGILPLYARAALPMVPGASLLPFVAGRRQRDARDRAAPRRRPGRSRSARRLRPGLRLHAARRAARDVSARAGLSPAHGADDGRPLPVRRVGLVHLANRITQHRPIAIAEALDLAVRTTPMSPTPRAARSRWSPRRAWAASWCGRTSARCCAAARRRRRQQKAGGERTPADGTATPAYTPANPARPSGAGRRPGPALRGRVGRPQPDPHARADGEAVRLPARDRPRDVDEGALPGGAGEPPARRLHGRRRASGKPILLPGRVAFGATPTARQIDFSVRDAKRHTPTSKGAS